MCQRFASDVSISKESGVEAAAYQTILRQLSAHANQHLGEINYLRGLMGLPGTLG